MVRLLDGSMWEQLKKFGYDCCDEKNKPHWSFPANSDQKLMENVYKSFLDIGVNVITTNTYHFGSTLDKELPSNAAKRDVYDIYFEETCETLCKVVKNYPGAVVFGSVGTFATQYHDCSEYTGCYMDYENAEVNCYNYYKTILTLFQDGTSIRNLIFETISSALEGQVALKVLEEFPEMKAVMSFSFKENSRLRHGESVHEIAGKLGESNQILGIGINCTDAVNVMPVLTELRKYKFSEIFVYPNVGDSKFLEEGPDETDVFSQKIVNQWVDNGATAIGGCCGIDEEQMKLLKKLIDNIDSK